MNKFQNKCNTNSYLTLMLSSPSHQLHLLNDSFDRLGLFISPKNGKKTVVYIHLMMTLLDSHIENSKNHKKGDIIQASWIKKVYIFLKYSLYFAHLPRSSLWKDLHEM